MAQAYSPGLTVTDSIVLRKDRILPLKGKVLVKKGDKVKADDFVAETLLPGKVVPFNLANKLGVDPKFMKDYIKIKETIFRSQVQKILNFIEANDFYTNLFKAFLYFFELRNLKVLLSKIYGSKNVIELHGNIMRTKCFDDGRIVTNWPPTDETPPHCPHCGGLLRPDVVWFGEGLPYDALATAVAAAQSCDIFFSLGTSSLVQPAASLPGYAIRNGRVTVEINPQPTPITRQMDVVLAGPSGEVLPALLAAAWEP